MQGTTDVADEEEMEHAGPGLEGPLPDRESPVLQVRSAHPSLHRKCHWALFWAGVHSCLHCPRHGEREHCLGIV